MRYLTIGELASQTGVSKVAIRYYERFGLIPKAIRQTSGYRSYPKTIVARIRFIKNAKSVGFTLDEIAELLTLQEHEKATSQQIKSHTLTKLNIIQEKILSLQKMEQALEQLTASCDGKVPLHQCPILEKLYGEMGEVEINPTS